MTELEKLHEWTGSGSMAFCLLMENETLKTLKLHERHNQPCYGELRTYSKGEHRPSDLHHPFPEGRPIGLAVKHYTSDRSMERIRFFCSDKSPYRQAFASATVTKTGLVWENLDIPPTVLVAGLMALKNSRSFTDLRKDFPKEDIRFINLLSYFIQRSGPYYFPKNSGYFLSPYASPYRVINGLAKPEGLLSERTPYNRKELHDLFGTESKWVRPKGYSRLDPEDVLLSLKEYYEKERTTYETT